MKFGVAALAAMLLAAAPVQAEVKIALDTKPDLETSGSYNWAHAFGEALTAAGMEVREMPRGSIGDEAEKLDQLSLGLLEVSLSDVRSVGQIDPFIYGVRLPYIFDDVAHMYRALDQGKVLDRVNEAIAGQDVKLLALVPWDRPRASSPRPGRCVRPRTWRGFACVRWTMPRSRFTRHGARLV